jgi:hypothetical protein
METANIETDEMQTSNKNNKNSMRMMLFGLTMDKSPISDKNRNRFNGEMNNLSIYNEDSGINQQSQNPPPYLTLSSSLLFESLNFYPYHPNLIHIGGGHYC